ncbi:MAG: sulfite exporter TauE/SafE family protein [Silicimonas sp.]|nr:sulfite exporter TauE/SafE family protein [Silicimonas sp.]
MGEYLLLALAGLVGGMVNVAAGGAKLFVFPLLLSLGLPPLAANATGTVALWPSTLPGAFAPKGSAAKLDNADLRIDVPLVGLGGVLGVALLIGLGEKVFVSIVPFLLILALAVIAFGERLKALAERAATQGGKSLRRILLFICGIYAGYFGAGLGFFLMASMIVSGTGHFHSAVRQKNLFAAIGNTAAVAVLVFSGLVSWLAAAIIFVFAVIGATIGAAIIPKISPGVLRGFILLMGTLLTARFVIFG